jgi:hypothetical protein
MEQPKVSCLMTNCITRDYRGCSCQWCIQEIQMMKSGLIGFKGDIIG